MCLESANPPRSLHCRGETRWRPLASTNVSDQAVFRNVNRSGNVIVHPHRDSDQHQTLVASRGSTLARVYHVWRTFVNAFVSYPAHRLTNWHIDRQTDRQASKQHRSHNSALTEQPEWNMPDKLHDMRSIPSVVINIILCWECTYKTAAVISHFSKYFSLNVQQNSLSRLQNIQHQFVEHLSSPRAAQLSFFVCWFNIFLQTVDVSTSCLTQTRTMLYNFK